MFEDDERHGGVTYIGPRSFVAGFALLCAAFVALVYGAERLVGSADVSLPGRTGSSDDGGPGPNVAARNGARNPGSTSTTAEDGDTSDATEKQCCSYGALDRCGVRHVDNCAAPSREPRKGTGASYDDPAHTRRVDRTRSAAHATNQARYVTSGEGSACAGAEPAGIAVAGRRASDPV